MTRPPRLVARIAISLVVVLGVFMALVPRTSAHADAGPTRASEAARQVINSGPYQRVFPGEKSGSDERPRRSNGSLPAWRPPSSASPSQATTETASSVLLAVGLIVGLIAAAALLLAIGSRLRALRLRQRPPVFAAEKTAPSAPPLSTGDKAIAEARALLARGDGPEAVLLLWRHGVSALLAAGPPPRDLDADLTGRELVRALKRRGQSGPTQLAGLDVLLYEMEHAWFGRLSVTETQFVSCVAALRVLLDQSTNQELVV